MGEYRQGVKTWWLHDLDDHKRRTVAVEIKRDATDLEITHALNAAAKAELGFEDEFFGDTTFKTVVFVEQSIGLRIAYVNTPGDGLVATSNVFDPSMGESR